MGTEAKRKNPNHTHKVRLIVHKSGYKEFYCVLDKCTYRVRAEFMLGKKSLCNQCGKEFEITNYHLRIKLPKCIDCIPRKDTKRKFVLPNKSVIQFGKSNPVDDLASQLHTIIMMPT